MKKISVLGDSNVDIIITLNINYARDLWVKPIKLMSVIFIL